MFIRIMNPAAVVDIIEYKASVYGYPIEIALFLIPLGRPWVPIPSKKQIEKKTMQYVVCKI